MILWSALENGFAKHYCQNLGRPAKPIRLMAGLLILKQLENLSDDKVVLECNPYYQVFCGLTEVTAGVCDRGYRGPKKIGET